LKNFKNKFKSKKPKTKRFSKPFPEDNTPNTQSDTKAFSSDTQAKNDEHKIRPTKVKSSKRINGYLLALILLYVVIEIVFNYILVSEMTYSTTALDIQDLERNGKIITGFGIALLMSKSLLNHANLKFKLFIKYFAAFLGVGIGISFLLQTAIVNYVVGHASPKDQQRALLVSAAATTVVPFYDNEADTNRIKVSERFLLPFYKAVSSESNYSPIQIKYQRIENFYKTSRICSPIVIKTYANHYPIQNTLSKAFFSYSHLIATKTYEDLHKKAITDYYSCIFDDDVLVGMYADNLQVLKDKVSEFYKEYLEKSDKYNINLKKYPNRKDRIDDRWQSGTTDTLGFDSTLPPNLPFEAFIKRPDVKNYMTSNQAIKMPYPYASDMSSELKNSLPDLILVNYLIAKEEGIAEDDPELKEEKESDLDKNEKVSKFSKIAHYFEEPSLTLGKKSYKAVVMPMIALGFSVTFLVLNVISMLSLIILKNSKKVSTWFQRIVTIIFFILPFVISPSTPLIIPPNESMFLTIVIKFLYFYQHLVWNIQQAIIGIF